MEDKVVAYRSDKSGAEFVFPVRDGQGWISLAQMAEIFDTGQKQIRAYIRCVFSEGKLDKTKHTKQMYTLKNEPHVRRIREAKRIITYYSFFVAKDIGLRIKSKDTTYFRQWLDDVAGEIPRIDSKPLIETVDLRTPRVELSAIDVAFRRWMHRSQGATEPNRFRPRLYSSAYNAVSTHCLDLLKKAEEKNDKR